MIRLTLGAAVLAAVISLAPDTAQARPDVRNMSCDQIQRLVDSRGAVVVTTGQFTFERIVSARRFCDRDDILRVTAIRGAGGQQCGIRWRCERRLRRNP